MLKLPAEKLELMDDLGSRGIPFLFIISFDGNEVHVWQDDEVPEGVKFSVPMLQQGESQLTGRSKEVTQTAKGSVEPFALSPVRFDRYRAAFNKVMSHLRRGDTYLINLTMPTAIEAPLTLQQIYDLSNAQYKLLFNERFV